MSLRLLGIIVGREYLNKVRKKSFLIITFVVPVLFAMLCILPAVLMKNATEGPKKVAVVDRSGIVMQRLGSSESLTYVDYSDFELDTVKNHIGDLGYDAVLCISPLDSAGKTVAADVYSRKPLGMDTSDKLSRGLNSALEEYRIGTSGVENLKALINEVRADVKLHQYTVDENGSEAVTEAGVFSAVSLSLGTLIYLFISLFAGMVMSSVIEEKSSRVVEVLVSSVKSTDLMFGKIIGVALVALTQFLLWIILTVVLVGLFALFAGQDFFSASDFMQMVQIGNVGISQSASSVGDLPRILATLRSMPFAKILLSFLVYFIFGYILYAAVFAAIGSSAENEADTQQLQIPVTVPLILGFFIAIIAMKAPDNPLVYWGSMIPFTSPIVMLARIPFGVPGWELALSIGLLVVTTVVFAWLSARIYRAGILHFGKKSTWKDLLRWMKL